MSNLRSMLARSFLRRIVIWKFGVRRIPVSTPHFELSLIYPLEEAAGSTSPDLIELALQAARGAADIDLRHLHDRSATARQYLSNFPGEHYQLLASLVKCLNPSHVTEIGTYTGLSALTILSTLGKQAKLTTYDVVPWDKIEGRALRSEDFADGRLEQRIGDLADPQFYTQNQSALLESELIFVDGPKDGAFEPAFIDLLLKTPRNRRALLMFDDIRLWNMLRVWADLPLPKLDLTSFGHWSGTGVCWLGGV
ncbi:MAG: methyltransferase [Candidatus Dormibacterales bacterium]